MSPKFDFSHPYRYNLCRDTRIFQPNAKQINPVDTRCHGAGLTTNHLSMEITLTKQTDDFAVTLLLVSSDPVGGWP
jgi:hypothetical protein